MTLGFNKILQEHESEYFMYILEMSEDGANEEPMSVLLASQTGKHRTATQFPRVPAPPGTSHLSPFPP